MAVTQGTQEAKVTPAGDNLIGRAKISDGTDVALVDDNGNFRVIDGPASAVALANVSSSATNVTLQASNAARRALIIYNDSTAVLYVKFGATATTSSFTYALTAAQTLELPKPIYTGIVDGIWASANGAARMTEIT